MQAILKSKHQRFCNFLQDAKLRQPESDEQLNQLEDELLQFYEVYQQKREELRKVIERYEEKQKLIRNRVKQNQRYNLVHKNGSKVHQL